MSRMICLKLTNHELTHVLLLKKDITEHKIRNNAGIFVTN